MSQNAVNYLILISNEMISNKIFIFIVFFIEICPLFYSSAFFAFKISNNSSPSDIFNRLSYISYYEKQKPYREKQKAFIKMVREKNKEDKMKEEGKTVIHASEQYRKSIRVSDEVIENIKKIQEEKRYLTN